MKKLIIFLTIILQAQIIDKIVAIVEDNPITSYEVKVFAKKYNLPLKRALDILIEKKLLFIEAKKRGIEVDDFDIENAIEKIARRNGMSVLEFKLFLKNSGKYKEFIDKLKDDLLKKKLFQSIVKSKMKISQEELKTYYLSHKNEFKQITKVYVTEYKSNTPDFNNSTISQRILDYNSLPQNLKYIFSITPERSFTPVLKSKDGFLKFYVNKKEGEIIPFSLAKKLVANKLILQKQKRILREYLNTLKNKVVIKENNV